MSKTIGQTFWYRFGKKPKRSRICLLRNRLFWFCPESALLGQIEMISFDKTNSGMNTNVLVSFLLDMVMFVERLWNISSFTVLILLLPPALPFPPWPGQSYRQHHGFFFFCQLRAVPFLYSIPCSLCVSLPPVSSLGNLCMKIKLRGNIYSQYRGNRWFPHSAAFPWIKFLPCSHNYVSYSSK
jgi:hypothetical protein